jgi:hypothetical protein
MVVNPFHGSPAPLFAFFGIRLNRTLAAQIIFFLDGWLPVKNLLAGTTGEKDQQRGEIGT